MSILVIIVFILGYIVIAFEQPLKLNKAAPALFTGVLCWTIYILSGVEQVKAGKELLQNLSDISAILFFLLGAMTIVELIANHNGFELITQKIKTKSKVKLLWIISFITFCLSAILNNMTTAIVMTSLAAKLLQDKNDRLWFAGMIIIAANAGGAFSPIGDVTTTMLWIGKQVTAQNIIVELFLPALMVTIVPLLIISFKLRNQTIEYKQTEMRDIDKMSSGVVLISGIILLLLVPVFKVLTSLPPFMGVLFALSILWIIVAVINYKKPAEKKLELTAVHALKNIDIPGLLFFLGILLAVAAIQSFGMLKQVAVFLDNSLGNIYMIGTSLGVASAFISNVPLVAATQGMYNLSAYPTDHPLWEFIALATGTGGSIIVFGSAAGIAAMGIEKIEFMW
ncbi:MAG: sodium:proton antiporter NhaD, partial [Bacteroidota bacterium]|nr:sodium:proton antiporter NhaD [Bacteroidota bacterium]